jgi:hypothetical protein
VGGGKPCVAAACPFLAFEAVARIVQGEQIGHSPKFKVLERGSEPRSARVCL